MSSRPHRCPECGGPGTHAIRPGLRLCAGCFARLVAAIKARRPTTGEVRP